MPDSCMHCISSSRVDMLEQNSFKENDFYPEHLYEQHLPQSVHAAPAYTLQVSCSIFRRACKAIPGPDEACCASRTTAGFLLL